MTEKRSRVTSWRTRLLLLIPAADAIFVVVLLTLLQSGPMWDPFTVGVTVYNLLAPASLAALIVAIAKRWPRGMPVVVVACLLLPAAHVAALIDMYTSDSSTAVLLLLFLPFYFCVAVLLFAGVAILVGRGGSAAVD